MRVILYLGSVLIAIAAASFAANADDRADCKAAAPAARIAACTRIIEGGNLSPKDLASAYRFRAFAVSRRNETDEANADIKEAIRIHPESAAFSRGYLDIIQKDYEAAISELDEAIRLDPRNADIYNLRGVAYARKGDQARGRIDYNEAIKLDPGSAVALANRARSYQINGELEPALADLKEAVRLAPKYPVPYYVRSLVLERQDDFDSAIAECNKAIELDPQYADAFNERASLNFSKNDLDRAIADANTAIELDPQQFNAYNIRARVYGTRGEFDRALAELNTAIQVNPKVPYLYGNRGNVYASKKNFDRAIADYEFSIQLNAKSPLPYYNRGKAYEVTGKKDRALADYRKVLELPASSNTDKQRQEIVRQRIARLTQTEARNGSAESAPAPAPAPPAAKRVALVIGNGKYTSVGELANPANDARDVAASLRRLSFDHVVELHDSSRESMGRALKEFGDWAERAEWAVVFYAGHGLEMNGVTYLIPTDAELARDSHVADEAISLTQVQAKVDAASKLGLIILDSCRNNPFLARMARSGGSARAIGRGLAAVEPEGSVLVAYSAKHGTTASDGSGNNSPFSEALLHHIEEPGLEINFLFRRVRDEVRSKTQRQQEPFLYGSLSSEPLYFKEGAAK